MGNNSAGSTGGGNEGQTDLGRGSVLKFSYTKEKRATGKVGGGISTKPNSNTKDGNKETASDKRLTS